MKRRDFMAAATLAGTVPLTAIAAAAQQPSTNRWFYELRKYHLIGRGQGRVLDDFLSDTALPAWNRLGIEPVGVFTVMYGPTSPTVYVLLPYPSLETLVAAESRLATDAQYQRDGAAFLDTPATEPAYVRIESSLMQAFERLPRLVVPESTADNSPRIFELRTYESHNKKKARLKVEMFNTAEIDLFLEIGLKPVFFGETLIGPDLPNLTYMVVFDDMADRDATWATFNSSPGWSELRSDPVWADTVSNINVSFLSPTGYSQL